MSEHAPANESIPPDDPFEALGVAPAFPVDGAALERAWLRLSATHHPDRAADPQHAAQSISAINRARQALADPESAARALLDRLGGPPAGEVKDLPDGMLMGMLEIRERMDEALASRDPALLDELEAWANNERAGFIERVTELFARVQADGATDERLRELRVQLNGWRYIERMREQLHPPADPHAGLA